MKSTRTARAKTPAKASTGITAFDEITGGGLPHGRTTLLLGGPGSGKTVLALQFLVHGAAHCSEPGIFVAFEEGPERVVANAESFGWNLVDLQRNNKLYFVDAQPRYDLVQAGDFDLGGLLAALAAKASEIGARRIVFDALDVPLTLLADTASERREIYRLHAWLLAHDLTGVITLKSASDDPYSVSRQPLGFMQFMVDCTVILSHSMMQGISERSVRVQKYRGSSFEESASPFLIGATGFEIATQHPLHQSDTNVSSERISSGVNRLDTMLGGGYFRGASVLITGYAGTAKTTLCGAFAEAACDRGERTLFVCSDTYSAEVIRNLASVGIQLDRFVDNGTLCMVSARNITGSAEAYLMRIKALAKQHEARCIVLDPASAWSTSSTDLSSQHVAGRLIDWAKRENLTLICTRMFDEVSRQVEGGSQLQISALVDTWIHLNYLIQAGERNRGLSIVKSRGSAHSNQVRELILTNAGMTLTDTYTAGGEVLMGTLRWEKERTERAAREATEVAQKLKSVKLDAEEAELEVRLKSLQTELIAKQVKKALLASTTQIEEGDLTRDRTQMKEMRGADSGHEGPK